MSMDKYLFYAKASKGFIPKTMFDALATSMNRITLRLTKDGIYMRQTDTEEIRYSKILWDVAWDRKNFSKYIHRKSFNITLNSKHIQKMLRSVKKKESVAFFITKDDENCIQITIQPTGTQPDGPVERSETVSLSIYHVKDEDLSIPELPDVWVDEQNIERKAYGYPMVIGASDFQKIKKMSTTAKTINITIQRNNYISFYAGDTMVLSSRLTFGELTMNPDIDSEDEYETVLSEENDEYPHLYKQSFNMVLFASLIKLPGLTTQMEFYAPKFEGFPLKVTMNDIAGLGVITVFVKDQEQIDNDEQTRFNDNHNIKLKSDKNKK